MEYVVVSYSKSGLVSITMNRPEVGNAFNNQMIEELIAAFTSLDDDSSCRLILLQSSGKHFSAGADINWMKSMAKLSLQENQDDAHRLALLMRTIYQSTKPVIARVQGAAFGGALGLIAACDIAVAQSDARFCLSEVKIGLVPAVISPYVIEAIGVRYARRYMLSAELFHAQQALDMGLLHAVVDSSDLDQWIGDLTTTLLGNSPQALATCKQLIQHVSHQPITDDVIAHTAKVIAEIRVSSEGQEGLSSFLEKRSPNWLQEGNNND